MTFRTQRGKLPSNRSVGLLFAGVFVVVALWPLISGGSPRLWSFGVALAFALTACFAPHSLTSVNRAWMAFGALLHRIVSPVVLGSIYFLLITPIAWIMRLAGRDALTRRAAPKLHSYWIVRTPPGPDAPSFRDPF